MSIPEKILQAGCDAYAATFLNGNGSLGDAVEAAYLAIHGHDDWVRAGPPAWTGEGLPPVGTVCEHQPYGDQEDWHRVEIIAEEARIAELNLMVGAIKDYPGGRHGVDHMTQLKIHEEACINLYDAGWRKQVES